MGDMGEFWRDLKPELKERRKKARDSAHERIAAFFRRNEVEFEGGNNTLIFRTPQGTVAYYPPSQRMQHKNHWKYCSPTYCMNYVKKTQSRLGGSHINSASFEAFSLCPLNRKESHHDAIIAIGWRHHVRLLPDRIRIIKTLSPPYPCGSQTTGGVMPHVNHNALRAAQSKAVIARFLGDAGMWLQANKQMKAAVSMPWYRRPQ